MELTSDPPPTKKLYHKEKKTKQLVIANLTTFSLHNCSIWVISPETFLEIIEQIRVGLWLKRGLLGCLLLYQMIWAPRHEHHGLQSRLVSVSFQLRSECAPQWPKPELQYRGGGTQRSSSCWTPVAALFPREQRKGGGYLKEI